MVDDVLTFRRLGPEAPEHVGVTGGPGLIWFVSRSLADPGLQRYCEPDLIRLGHPGGPNAARPPLAHHGVVARRRTGSTHVGRGRPCQRRHDASPRMGPTGSRRSRARAPQRHRALSVPCPGGLVSAAQPDTPDLPAQLDLIAGSWREPGRTRDDWVEDPNTGERLQPQARTSDDGVEAALAAADALHRSGDWQRRPAAERAEVLLAYADALEPECPTIAQLESATTGATIGTTSMLGFILHAAFRLAAAQLRRACCRRGSTGRRGRDVEVERRGLGAGAPAVPVERAGAHGRPQGGLRAGGRLPGHHQATRTCAARHRRDRRAPAVAAGASAGSRAGGARRTRGRRGRWSTTPASAASASPAGVGGRSRRRPCVRPGTQAGAARAGRPRPLVVLRRRRAGAGGRGGRRRC